MERDHESRGLAGIVGQVAGVDPEVWQFILVIADGDFDLGEGYRCGEVRPEAVMKMSLMVTWSLVLISMLLLRRG